MNLQNPVRGSRRSGNEGGVTSTVFGPARCIECGALWRVIHVTLAEEGCIRCRGRLVELEPSDAPLRRPQLQSPIGPRPGPDLQSPLLPRPAADFRTIT